MSPEIKGCQQLRAEVIDRDLCSLCGACVGMCPYLVAYKGRVVALDDCNVSQGRCYAFCPRTATDLDLVSDAVFGASYDPSPVGRAKEVMMARAADEGVRSRVGDGGVVSALVSFALEQGIIDSVVLTDSSDDNPGGVLLREPRRVIDYARSKNIVAPILAAFNREAGKEEAQKIGVVALPCQALALAKMRASPLENRNNIDKLTLVVGLFCRFLRRECVVCLDLTGEFADISVGVEGLPDWNILIIRSSRGQELVDAARARGVIEVEALSEENLDRLREASLRKRKTGLGNIAKVTGSEDDLLYVVLATEARKKLVAGQ